MIQLESVCDRSRGARRRARARRVRLSWIVRRAPRAAGRPLRVRRPQIQRPTDGTNGLACHGNAAVRRRRVQASRPVRLQSRSVRKLFTPCSVCGEVMNKEE